MAHPNQHDEGRPADITVGLARQAALAEAYPMPEKQAYELFDEYGGHCSPLLPVISAHACAVCGTRAHAAEQPSASAAGWECQSGLPVSCGGAGGGDR